MGKSTINGHFQYYVNLPEGNPNPCDDFADFGVGGEFVSMAADQRMTQKILVEVCSSHR